MDSRNKYQKSRFYEMLTPFFIGLASISNNLGSNKTTINNTGTLAENIIATAPKGKLNDWSSGGNYALHFAAMHDSVKYVQLLMQHGAEVNIQNINGRTPLHWAAKKGFKDVVNALMDNGADANISNKHNHKPLCHAIAHGHFDCAKIIYQHKNFKLDSNVYRSILQAINKDNYEIVQALLTKAAEAKVENKINFWCSDNNNGDYALHLAAMNDNVKLVQLLIKHGAKVNIENSNGSTPLHVAAGKGFKDVVNALINHGANAGTKNKAGKTPIDLAQNDTIKGLLSASSNSARHAQALHAASPKAKKKAQKETKLHKKLHDKIFSL